MAAEAVLKAEEKSAWVTLSWREGSRGEERAKFRALRLWRVDADGTRHVGWLIGQRPARSQRGDPKWRYFWSNFPALMPLDRMVEYAHRRCAPQVVDREVPRGSEAAAGLGRVSGEEVRRVPPAHGGRDAELQLPRLDRLDRVAREGRSEAAREEAPLFFPLGRIAGGTRCPRCIGRWLTGSSKQRYDRRFANYRPCATTLSDFDEAVLAGLSVVIVPWPEQVILDDYHPVGSGSRDPLAVFEHIMLPSIPERPISW